MSGGTYDFIVLGGGHNGLIASAYLAKAGFSVACLEANEEFGGGVRSGEVCAPGYISDLGGMVHSMLGRTPIVRDDELGLFSKYGFEYCYSDALFCSIFPDETHLIVDPDFERTVGNIAQFSKKDAETYREFHDYMVKMFSVAAVGGAAPPPPYGTMQSVMYASPEGREFQRVLSSSAQQICEEWFESEQVRVTFTRWCTEMMIDPRAIGTATLLYFTGNTHNPATSAVPFPKGGSNKLIEALKQCCIDSGVELFNNSFVDDIKVVDGEVKTVHTTAGDEFTAKTAVVSTINIKTTYAALGDDAPADEALYVKRLKHADFSALNQSFALSKVPEFKTGDDVLRAFCIEFAPWEKEYLEIFSNYRLGGFSPKLPLITIPSLIDDTRCPEGHSIVNVYSYAPWNLDGDPKNWEEKGDDLKKAVWEFFKSRTKNITDDDVVGSWGLTPVEYSKWNPAMLEGDIGHIGLQPSQMYDMRPLVGRGHDYHGAIENLYFVGADAHPGSGITGGARTGVGKILDDYGIDLRDIVKK